MELSDMGEHVFAAQRILKQRIRKVLFSQVTTMGSELNPNFMWVSNAILVWVKNTDIIANPKTWP